MSISKLPPEILENIFCFLDGRSFCIARRVCSTWNIIIKDMQKKQSYWKNFCIREIPINVLQEVLGFKSEVWDDIAWMIIYRKWFASRMILKSPYWQKTIYSFDNNPITCIRLSGSWVLTGHSNGLICVWNYETGDLTQSCMCHLKTINDMALVDLLNLGSYYGLEDLPWGHHHMVTISKDRYINVIFLLEPLTSSDSRLHINYHTDDIKQIKIFGDIFAVRSHDNTLSLWKMKLVRQPLFDIEVNFLQKIVGPEDYLLSIGLWQDQVQCVTYSGKLKSIAIHEEHWAEEREFKSSSKKKPEAIISVTAAFLFREKTAILQTSDGRIMMSVNEDCSKRFNLMKTLKTEIVSIAFYGTILALGGENGKLFLYYVFSEEELISIELSKPNSTLKLSEASIISIDIFYQYDSPVIAASTNECIHIFKWYRQSHQKVKKRDLSRLFT